MRGFIFFVLMCWSVVGWGQATDKFTVQFGGLGDDEGQKIIQTFDTGYAIIGSTGSFGNGTSDMYLLKLDKAGFLQWSKTIGGANIENGYGIVQLKDSGYIVVGNTNSRGYGGYDGYIVRTNKVGDTIWTHSYGGADWDFLYDVKALSDTTFIAVGKTMSFGSGEYDAYVINFKENGDTIRTKLIGGLLDDDAKSVCVTYDNKILIGGSTNSFGAGMSDYYYYLLNANDSILWTKTLGGIKDDVCNKVIQPKDSVHFLLNGSTQSFGGGMNDFYVIKTTLLGDTIYSRRIGSYDDEQGFGLCLNDSLKYGICGSTAGSGYHTALVIENDSLGYPNFQTKFAGFTFLDAPLYYGDAYDIITTVDSGYIMVGKCKLLSENETNVYVVKANHELGTATEIKDISNITNNVIYPVPFDDYFTISLPSHNNTKQKTIFLYDYMGNLILEAQSNLDNKIKISTQFIDKGFYVVKIINSATAEILYNANVVKL